MTPAAIFQTLAKLVLPLAVLALLYAVDKRAEHAALTAPPPRPRNPSWTACHSPSSAAASLPPRSARSLIATSRTKPMPRKPLIALTLICAVALCGCQSAPQARPAAITVPPLGLAKREPTLTPRMLQLLSASPQMETTQSATSTPALTDTTP
jgi:hypothetical protein